jgi:adenylate cyclase
MIGGGVGVSGGVGVDGGGVDGRGVRGGADVGDLERLEELLLGGRRRYTREQVSGLAGVDVARARRWWRALGFANVEDGSAAFTDSDLAALRRLLGMLDGGLIDEPLAVELIRALGQATARLAQGQVEALLARRTEGAEAVDSPARVSAAGAVAERLLPDLEELLVFAWRRQLAAAAGRVLQHGDAELTARRLAVGFADLVGFTRLSERLEEKELSELVETFESGAADVVASLGGRVVKTLGDEVMFVTETPRQAAEVALQLIEVMDRTPVVPELRVGLAFGDVLSRMGDVFGGTVNLASRLTSLASPNATLVDAHAAAALGPEADYRLRALWRRPVRGLGLVEPWLLTRAPAHRPAPARARIT